MKLNAGADGAVGGSSYVTKPGNAVLPSHSHDIRIPNDGIQITFTSDSVAADNNKMNQIISGLLASEADTPKVDISHSSSSTTLTATKTQYIHYGLNNSKNFDLMSECT